MYPSILNMLLSLLTSFLSLATMRVLSSVVRSLVKLSLIQNTIFQVETISTCPHIECISFNRPFDEIPMEECNAIVYIHGGGFVIRDSADLVIAERLLPLLYEQDLPERPTVIMSILYPLAQDKTDNIAAIFDNIAAAIEIILKRTFKITALCGDSAGGYLALQAADYFKDRNITNKLCLIAPWLNPYSTKYTDRNLNSDFLDPLFLSRCRAQYFNSHTLRSSPDILMTSIANSNDEGCNFTQSTDADIDEILFHFRSAGVRVVAFDMDQTIVAQHSWGQMKRHGDALSNFFGKITPAFALLARRLHSAGFKLAVATHSDAAEYNLLYRRKEDYVIGAELVESLLASAVPELAEEFYIVAYNPMSRRNFDPKEAHKNYHVHHIAAHFGVDTKEVLLFDDDEGNIADTDNLFMAMKVNPGRGLSLPDILKALRKDRKKSHTNNDLSPFFNPLALDHVRLRKLPMHMLLIAGTKDIFFDDFAAFKDLIDAAHLSAARVCTEAGMELLVAEQWHVYPLFWQHPFRRLVIGLLSIVRAVVAALFQPFTVILQNNNRRKHRFKNIKFSLHQTVDCSDADIAIKKMATFFLK